MGPGTVVTAPGVVAVVPAKDEEERVGATVEALHRVPGVRHVVVVDDGSPGDVAAALPDDPRVRLVAHDGNRGLGAALNTGLDATSAPLVAYLPADDVWHADHLASLVALLDAESDSYALDVVSVIEATLEDPRPVLTAQRKLARGEADPHELIARE